MKRLLAGAACLVVLTGCSGKLSPQGTLQDQTAQLIDAANAKSVTGVHSAASALRTTIQNQVASGDLSAAQADTLRKLLSDIESEAELLTAASPTPSPSTSPTASPTPSMSPTPSPTPSLSPTPSPTPTESPTPSPTPQSATKAPIPTVGAGLGGEPTPTPT